MLGRLWVINITDLLTCIRGHDNARRLGLESTLEVSTAFDRLGFFLV